MTNIETLLDRLIKEEDSEFFGPCHEDSIQKVEVAFNISFPKSYRTFLKFCGGGGRPGEYISGIETGRELMENRGYIWFDTVCHRKEYELPMNLLVFYIYEDEEVYCIDISNYCSSSECEIVSFNLLSGETYVMFESFEKYLESYLDEY